MAPRHRRSLELRPRPHSWPHASAPSTDKSHGTRPSPCTITVGGRDTVDQASVTASITRWLKDQFPDVRVGGIACPSGVKLTAGRSFECTADMEGAQLPITVTLIHVDKDEYTSSCKLTNVLIYTDRAVEELRSNLPVVKFNFELASAMVDCGGPWVRGRRGRRDDRVHRFQGRRPPRRAGGDRGCCRYGTL
jgi:Domain of unknown function (DUF4333)